MKRTNEVVQQRTTGTCDGIQATTPRGTADAAHAGSGLQSCGSCRQRLRHSCNLSPRPSPPPWPFWLPVPTVPVAATHRLLDGDLLGVVLRVLCQ